MSNTGTRLQISDSLQLVTAPINACDLTGITILLAEACKQLRHGSPVPGFIELMGHDDVLQMLYDNGNLTLDEKSNGGLYEVETILDEINTWFSDADNVQNSMLGYTHEEMGVNIIDDKLTLHDASAVVSDVIHFIKTEINVLYLPLVHVDCMAGE